jgi:hypothetical protein
MDQRAAPHPVTGIDHVFVLTDALDAAAARWRRLGFTVTPRGLHSAHMGSGNHCLMLGDDYIELLGVLTPTEANAPWRAALESGGEGLHGVVCRIDGAAEAVEALAARGVAAGPVRDFERPVTLPDGATGAAAFSIANFAADETPCGVMFMCQHHTPETVWVPEWTAHPNGATALGAVAMIDERPRETAARFARLFAAGAVSDLPGGARVETGSAPLLVLSPYAAEQRYPGIELSGTPTAPFMALEVVADLDRAQAAVGKLAQPVPGGLLVSPDAATGTVLAFVDKRA